MGNRKTLADMTDAERIGLDATVKQVMQLCYKAHYQSGKIVKGEFETDAEYYNRNFVKTFDDKGYHTEELELHKDSFELTVYNEKKLAVKSISFSGKNTVLSERHLTYNENDKLIEYISKNAKGEVNSRIVHEYNKDNKQISQQHYHGTELPLYSYNLYTYDERGNLISNINYKADGTIITKFTSVFNEQNKQIESRIEYTDTSMAKHNSRSTFKYNKYGDCIELVAYNADGSVKQKSDFHYDYDDDGNKIIPGRKEFKLYYLDPGETEEFEYDEKGNWVKKLVYHKDVVRLLLEREIVYWDDDEGKTLTHPLELVDHKKDEGRTFIKEPEMDEKELQWLAEGNTTADQFPLVRYYTLRYREFPSIITYNHPYIEVMELMSSMKQIFSANVLHSFSQDNGYGPRLMRFTMSFPAQEGYLMHVQNIASHKSEEFDLPSDMHKLIGNPVHTGQVQLLKPGEAFDHRDKYFEQEINGYIDACIIEKQPEKPFINIIEVANNNFVMREHSVDDNFQIKDLEINYGYGFLKFHEELLKRFSTSTKGLVLFHGEPGTGKTYYIRHLLRTMVARNKVVIYMPPNMVDHLAEPAFFTFLTQQVKSWSTQGFFCVLLIEDAEPLLARRQEGVRIQGITNLLNMSDGILNDMLNLQIICTFNVSVRKLDSALLRPGRLIARKEFKALSVIDANRLAQRLDINYHFKTPATLGEIYAMQKNANTLLHDVEHNDGSSLPIDDLV